MEVSGAPWKNPEVLSMSFKCWFVTWDLSQQLDVEKKFWGVLAGDRKDLTVSPDLTALETRDFLPQVIHDHTCPACLYWSLECTSSFAAFLYLG